LKHASLYSEGRGRYLDNLWRLSETEWVLALRRPEPVARKKPGKVTPRAVQLVLPEFGLTG